AAADSSKLSSAQESLPPTPAGAGGACLAPANEQIGQTCGNVVRFSSQAQTDRNIRNVSFIVAGALGVATLSTFFFWPARRAALAPAMGPNFAGIVAQGEL